MTWEFTSKYTLEPQALDRTDLESPHTVPLATNILQYPKMGPAAAGKACSCPATWCLSFPPCPLQALKTMLLRTKEKILNIAVCPGEKSHWDVRGSVMSGNGKCAVFLEPTLRLELPHLQEKSPRTQRGQNALLFQGLRFSQSLDLASVVFNF